MIPDLQFLNQCDEICVMKDGNIIERGTHEKLMAQAGEYASMVQAWQLSQTNGVKSDNNRLVTANINTYPYNLSR